MRHKAAVLNKTYKKLIRRNHMLFDIQISKSLQKKFFLKLNNFIFSFVSHP